MPVAMPVTAAASPTIEADAAVALSFAILSNAGNAEA